MQRAAALDEWASLRRGYKVKGWKQLLALSRALDPDPSRNGLRDILEGKATKTLKELAASAHSEPLPVPTVVLLARLSRGTDAAEQALRVLRQL